MSYHVEFGQSWHEAFYQEFLMIDAETGDPLPSNGIDHQFKVCNSILDYGDWIVSGQIIASNSNGLIYPTTEPGISAIKIPPTGFGNANYARRSSREPMPCALLAVPTNADDTKTILTGTISFGARTMNPRLTLKATPFYPAPNVPTPNATQAKIQLAAQGLYDAVEAALPGAPLDPARQVWASGGPVTTGGPLYNVIATALSWNTAAMSIFLTAAAAQLT